MDEEKKKFLKRITKLAIIFLCIIGFAGLLLNVFEKEIMTADVVGYKYVSKFFISDLMTPVAKIITNIGGVFVVPVIALLSLVFLKNKKIGAAICINLFLITFLNQVLKWIVQRPRPTEFRIVDEKGYSFPSGHSMVSMAFYGFIMYLIYKKIKNKRIKYGLMTLLTMLIGSIGISRIYLGVHYTSDVLAGFLISISYLVVYTSIIRRLVLDQENNEKN